MATTKEAVKLKKGDAVKFNSRTISNWKGKGEFVRYEGSGRGTWLIVKSADHEREIALRESQVKPAASGSAKPAKPEASKPAKGSTAKPVKAKSEAATAEPAAPAAAA